MTNEGLIAAGEAGRREAAKVAKRYQLRRVVNRKGARHLLECGHWVGLPSSDFGIVPPRGKRRCHQCPIPSEMCRCGVTDTSPHWKDEHWPRCSGPDCRCIAFRPVRIDLR